MERRANYALVGALSIALLAGALIFIVWLAQFQFNQTWDEYRIIFRGPVSGLSRGGEVQFNGIRVGEITSIRLDPVDPNNIITDIRIQHETPVRADSMAQTVSQGITGVRFVQISPGSPERPLLRKSTRERPPIIAAQRSRMEDMVQNVSDLTRDAAKALRQVNTLLSDENIASMKHSLSDVAAVTGELRARKTMFANIEGTFAKLDRAAADFERTAASARASLGGGHGTLVQLTAAIGDFRDTLGDARKLLNTFDGPATDFSRTTVPSLTAAVISVQRAADSLNRLTSEIRQDPREMAGRPSGREVEIPK